MRGRFASLCMWAAGTSDSNSDSNNAHNEVYAMLMESRKMHEGTTFKVQSRWKKYLHSCSLASNSYAWHGLEATQRLSQSSSEVEDTLLNAHPIPNVAVALESSTDSSLSLNPLDAVWNVDPKPFGHNDCPAPLTIRHDTRSSTGPALLLVTLL